MIKDHKMLIVLGSIILITLIIAYLFARFISTKGLIIKEYKVIDSMLPEEFYGLKIVHIGDIHYGRTVNKKELEHLVDEVNKLKPDIVVFTGDFIDKDTLSNASLAEEISDIMARIKASIGKYAVTGNHDAKNKLYTKLILESEFVLLDNTYDIVYKGGLTPIFIGGSGTYSYNLDSLEETFSYFNDDNPNLYKILLMHEPDLMTKARKYDVNLALAGHSHNGQVRLPFIGGIIFPKHAKTYNGPYYKVDDTHLFITSGVGTSGLNLRFFNKPSINLYRLVNK